MTNNENPWERRHPCLLASAEGDLNRQAGKDACAPRDFRGSKDMSEKQQTDDPFSYLADAFWASLPEECANELADFKKRVLNGVKSAVDSMIDHEINATDRHLENARRMREECRQKPTEEAPPNPA